MALMLTLRAGRAQSPEVAGLPHSPLAVFTKNPACAISALRADAKAKALPSEALPTIDTSPKDTAERRQVTVISRTLWARR
jgi:hypothetical protein